MLHWPQLAAIFTGGPEAADFSLHLKAAPLPLTYILAALGSALLFNLAPYFEELARCLGAERP